MTLLEHKLTTALEFMIRVYVDDYRNDGYPLTQDEEAAYQNAIRIIDEAKGGDLHGN